MCDACFCMCNSYLNSCCMRRCLFCLLFGLFVGVGQSLKAQYNQQVPLTYIKEQIKRWNSCKNVAITDACGGVALHESNGYASTGVPDGMANALKLLNRDGVLIDDVHLTEQGRWLVLFGDNGMRYYGLPKSLEDRMREFNQKGYTIYSVTFNDYGDWVIISNEYYSTSSQNLYSYIEERRKKYGQLWSACLTNSGFVAVFENGYASFGDVPQGLVTALKTISFDGFRVKFTPRGRWFVGNNAGNYEAYM